MKKLILIAILLTGISLISNSQTPHIEWQRCIGGSSTEDLSDVKTTPDGGFIMTGTTWSIDSGFDNRGQSDCFVAKLDSSGNLEWKHAYGGSLTDNGYGIATTYDGGYIMAGSTSSNDLDVSGNHGSSDAWVVKLDQMGLIQWQKAYGGSDNEDGIAIVQNPDSSYTVLGNASSTDGQVTGSIGGGDYWLIRIDKAGNFIRGTCYGGTGFEGATSFIPTADNGFVIAGMTWSQNTGQVTGNHGDRDFWIVKVDSNDVLKWEKCLGGNQIDAPYSLINGQNGGYVVAGATWSGNGDITSNHGAPDYWVVRTDDSCKLQWQHCYGGTNSDIVKSIRRTQDGGYVITGTSMSNDGDVTDNWRFGGGIWTIKTDSAGAIQWKKCIGGNAVEEGRCVIPMDNGSYIIAGNTSSTDGDVSGLNGGADAWLVKLSFGTVGIAETRVEPIAIRLSPNPCADKLQISTSNLPKDAFICVRNILGELLQKTAFATSIQTVSTSELAAGVYILSIESTDLYISRKLFITH